MTETEINSLLFKIVTKAYMNDGKNIRIIIRHLHDVLIEELGEQPSRDSAEL